MLISRSCPGAVLLLPLLDVHLSQLFQTVDSVRSGSHAAATRPSVPTERPGRQEFISSAGFGVEDIGLASLRLLYLLVVHSDEVRKKLQRRRQYGHVDWRLGKVVLVQLNLKLYLTLFKLSEVFKDLE